MVCLRSRLRRVRRNLRPFPGARPGLASLEAQNPWKHVHGRAIGQTCKTGRIRRVQKDAPYEDMPRASLLVPPAAGIYDFNT